MYVKKSRSRLEASHGFLPHWRVMIQRNSLFVTDNIYIYIYIEREREREREMVDFGESDKIIEIGGKVDTSSTYNVFYG